MSKFINSQQFYRFKHKVYFEAVLMRFILDIISEISNFNRRLENKIMFRPFHQIKSKKQLKIDQYKIKVHKLSDDPVPPFVAKSIILTKEKANDQNQKRQQTKKLTFVSENHDIHCHCSREERHRTAEKNRMVFRIKKSFTTHKYFKSTKGFKQEDDISQKSRDLSNINLLKMTDAILQAMKKTEIIIYIDQKKIQMQSQDLSKVIKFFITIGRKKSLPHVENVEGDEFEQQDILLKQLNQIVKNEEFKPYSCKNSQAGSSIEDNFRGDFNFEVQKRKKQITLRDIQKKINAKTSELKELQQNISHAKIVMQKYQSKKRQIMQNGALKNQQYIRQLCQQYKKHLEDTNSYSIFIQTWQAKNNAKISSFEDIQSNVKEQFMLINQFISEDRGVKNELDFVNDFLLRVMEEFRVKYTELERILQQKTEWISQLLQKNKKQAQFCSFKYEYLINLNNEFSLNYLQAENKLRVLKKRLLTTGSQRNNPDLPPIVDQIQAFLKRINQNYLLNFSFH